MVYNSLIQKSLDHLIHDLSCLSVRSEYKKSRQSDNQTITLTRNFPEMAIAGICKNVMKQSIDAL